MSKLVIDLTEEFQSIDDIDDDFEIFVLSIKIDDSGEITSTESTEPVSHISIDKEHEECLFHVATDGKTMDIAKTKETINSIDSGFLICSALEKNFTSENSSDESSVRIDNPIIGFGENIELKRFFLVCEA